MPRSPHLPVASVAVQPDSGAVKLSKRGEYALRALIDLGLAQELGRPMLQIGELSKKEKLPEKFLEQILVQLKGAGFVESRRGKRGGYSLARPMESISFGQVVRLIDGPLAPIACVSQTAYAPCTCPDEAHCGLRMLMLDVRNAIANVLDRYTLADIVQVTLRKLQRDKATFHLDCVPPILDITPVGLDFLNVPPQDPARDAVALSMLPAAKPVRRVPPSIPPRPKRKPLEK